MQAVTNWLRRAWLVLVVAGVIIGLDQWTKVLVRQNIPDYTSLVPYPSISDYFFFQHVHNYGAAFGILQNQRLLFTVIAVVVAIAILVYVRYLPLHQIFVRLLLGLQLGGAIGNLLDRLYQGYVTDFIVTGIPGFWYIPNYNIADSAIVTGVIGLGAYIFWQDYQQARRGDAEEEAVDESGQVGDADERIDPYKPQSAKPSGASD